MNQHAPRTETPKWDGVILICKQCRKRKNGPDDIKSKSLVKIARHHLKEQRPRPRVLSTGCLGVCPKGAVVVAGVGRGVAAWTLSVATLEEFDEAMPRLLAP